MLLRSPNSRFVVSNAKRIVSRKFPAYGPGVHERPEVNISPEKSIFLHGPQKKWPCTGFQVPGISVRVRASCSSAVLISPNSGAGQTLRHVQRDHDNVWGAMASYQEASVNHIEMLPKTWEAALLCRALNQCMAGSC